MYSVEIWFTYNHSNISYLLAPTVEDLFTLVCMLEKHKDIMIYIVRSATHGNRFLPKDFGWGDLAHWKINSNYHEE
jgi:hypothetical protein